MLFVFLISNSLWTSFLWQLETPVRAGDSLRGAEIAGLCQVYNSITDRWRGRRKPLQVQERDTAVWIGVPNSLNGGVVRFWICRLDLHRAPASVARLPLSKWRTRGWPLSTCPTGGTRRTCRQDPRHLSAYPITSKPSTCCFTVRWLGSSGPPSMTRACADDPTLRGGIFKK